MMTSLRKNVMPVLCLVGVVLTPLVCPPIAYADEYYYRGPISSEGQGLFSIPEYWTPTGGPPGSADVAVFDQDDEFDIYLSEPVTTNQLLRVTDGLVSLMLERPGDDPPTYELLGSGTFVQTAAIIGTAAGQEAHLRVHGEVGADTAPPAYVNVDGLTIIGQTAGSSGRLSFGRLAIATGPVVWNSAYPIWVGSAGDGDLYIPEIHRMISGDAVLGVQSGASGTSEIRGQWETVGSLSVGQYGIGDIDLWGDLYTFGDGYIAAKPGSEGRVEIHAGPSQRGEWRCFGSLHVGGDDEGVGGAGELIDFGGDVSVSGDVTIWPNSSISLYTTGAMDANDVYIRNDSILRVGDAELDCDTLNVYHGGILSPIEGVTNCETLNCAGRIHATGGTLNVAGELYQGVTCDVRLYSGGTISVGSLTGYETDWDWTNGSLYINNGSLTIGDGEPLGANLNIGENQTLSVSDSLYVGPNSDGVLTVDAGGFVFTDHLAITGEVNVLDGGVLNAAGGPIDIFHEGALNGTILGDDSTSVALYYDGASWSVPGSLLIGPGTVGYGHIHALSLQTGTTLNVDEEVTVHSVLGLAISGGTINADVFNLQDANLHDYGVINAQFLTSGSVTATGDLVLGDIDSSSGVQISGSLDVGSHHVTLNNQDVVFVYGPTSIDGGTLSAPNGFGITSSLQVSGFGVIDTPDDPAKYLLNDGAILGEPDSERIELTGYVKGFGTLDYVTISGVDAPGYDGPAAVNRGSVDYAGQLVIEIGGLLADDEHDQINHSATAGLGGELIVELINGFMPGPGDSFTIMTYADHTGQFDALSLPALGEGLEWDVDQGASSLTLTVAGQFDCPNPGFAGVYCLADIENGDCLVNLSDLARLLGNYGMVEGAVHDDGDLDDDGDVDLSDLASMLGQYGDDCN